MRRSKYTGNFSYFKTVALPRALLHTEKGKLWRRAVSMHTAREVAAVVSLVHAAHCNPVYKALVGAFRFGTWQMMMLCPKVVPPG